MHTSTPPFQHPGEHSASNTPSCHPHKCKLPFCYFILSSLFPFEPPPCQRQHFNRSRSPRRWIPSRWRWASRTVFTSSSSTTSLPTTCKTWLSARYGGAGALDFDHAQDYFATHAFRGYILCTSLLVSLIHTPARNRVANKPRVIHGGGGENKINAPVYCT